MKKLSFLFLLVVLLGGCQPSENASEPEADESEVAQPAEQPEGAVPADECQIAMGWDPWEPYHFAPIGGQVQGLDVDLVTAMAEEAGCELEFEQGSWASMLQLVRTGDIDLLVGATRTPEREEFAWFSEPYRKEEFRIYVRAEEVERWSGMDLRTLLDEGFRLGITQGYIYSDQVSQLLALPEYRNQFVEAAVGELNFTHLTDYRIDGFIEDPFVATAIERRRSWGVDIEPLPLDISSGQVHMMFSKATVDEDVVDRFDQGLAELKESGEYERILARYRND